MLEGAVAAGVVRIPADHVLAPAVGGADPPRLTDLHAFELCVRHAASVLT
jgi:hypothetical protein